MPWHHLSSHRPRVPCDRVVRLSSTGLLLLALAAGCFGGAGDQTLDVVYDPCRLTRIVPADGTTDAELAAIDEAIGFWNEVATVRFELSRADEADVVPQMASLPIAFEEAALAFRGVYQDEVGDVVVNRLLRDRDLSVTVAHEFGHALGLWHIDRRDSVMNRGNLKFAPLPADASELVELWGDCVVDPDPDR